MLPLPSSALASLADPKPGCLGFTPTLHFHVIRPDDLLILDFWLQGFDLALAGANAPPRIVRSWIPAPRRIIVKFQPQHIAEEAIFESAGNTFCYGVSVPAAVLPFLELNTGNSKTYDIAGLSQEVAKQAGIALPTQADVLCLYSGTKWCFEGYELEAPAPPTADPLPIKILPLDEGLPPTCGWRRCSRRCAAGLCCGWTRPETS
jgi:hypothetical protein